ncbi:Sterol uptake control protein 2 [Pseudocercospora fuligena]|uniref:Sterol uptake control protein 2 n=1 Tax=Pseudocercospora fuligena TaxID=685502 RepID=A0A8H6RML0_9PEZI|nr:Sterol uptake control protein 2 [Pseudocercospora fuligena]
MDLLHHYTAYTYKYMTDVPQNYPVWQVIVPGLAFKYPFLLHGLLAASALHRHYTAEPSQKPNLMNLARYHQQHALTLYIPLIQSIDEENCHALFAFSVLLGVLCYSMLHEDEENEQPLAVRFMEVFDSLGGAVVVAVVATQWLRDGPLGPIMEPLTPLNRDFSILEPGMATALEKLLECADKIYCDGSSKAGLDAQQRLQAYHNSIYGISTVLAPNNYENRKLSVVVSWSIIAGTDYISLLRQRDALAVVILGHYGVALHQLHNTVWVLEGLGKRLTDSVIGEVDECWHDVLTYAKAQVDQPVTPAQPKT